jgi:hypothetical protein
MGLTPQGTVPIETIYIGSLFEIEETVSTTVQVHSAKETVSERFGRTGVADFSVRFTKHIFAGSQRICTVSSEEESITSLIRDKNLPLYKRGTEGDLGTGSSGVADFSLREGMSFPQQRESTGVAGFSPRKETVSAIVQTNRPKQTVSDGVAGFSLRYYHPDHLGSSNIITDESGNQVQLLEYTPYGTLSRSEGLSL